MCGRRVTLAPAFRYRYLGLLWRVLREGHTAPLFLLISRCRGGWPIKAWEWIKENGVCTGGRYSAKNVCKPYAFYPCGNHTKEIWYGECPNQSWPTPKCRKACKYGYKTPYEKDKYYAKSAYILPNDEDVIKQEILANGPVQAVFDVYEDFRLYRKGIYRVKLCLYLIATLPLRGSELFRSAGSRVDACGSAVVIGVYFHDGTS
ncbi:hypothetical protein Y032_0028g1827 [Ancylostoma ceylanicum]|uniref:Peptidase C1A papain C-terminal domain-containing protein n=1 Tax=Ancylostoma ceylanicum TaxID=53326 RepID=A0A016UV72_9BILA|nr:hypothetical protein Y032_0028g1827 [Ancylostoma ceylanicum]